MRRLLHATALAAILALWTYLLLAPEPVPEVLPGDYSWFDKEMAKFLLAKSLHLSAYAFLAAFGGSLFPSARGRWMYWGVLVLHGIGTEIGQTYVPNRHGCVRDVLIDAAGIAVGAWALRWHASRGTEADA